MGALLARDMCMMVQITEASKASLSESLHPNPRASTDERNNKLAVRLVVLSSLSFWAAGNRKRQMILP